jgi:CRP/FNR family cyclic AMP-dependent transcriptional regulator
MDELEAVFSRRGWLSCQPQPFRKRFTGLGRLMALERGATVFHRGDDSGGVFGIVSGAVTVMGGTPWQLPAMAHVMRAGEWFGHGPVLRGGARTLTFIAAEPTTLLQVPLDRLRPQLQSDPDFAARLAQMADASTETVVWAARDLLIRDSARRLAAVLLRVTAMGEVPPGDGDGYALTQAELGEMANISRHHVNRILATMRRAGWIDARYNRIRLLDVAALKTFAWADE